MVFSPFSISSALSMTYVSDRSPTRLKYSI